MNELKLVLLLVIANLPIVASAYIIPEKNEKDKWGCVDESGKTIVPFKYDEIQTFVDGIFKVEKNHKWGLINEAGKEIVSPKYDLIEIFAHNIYRVAAGGKLKDGVLMEEKYGFIAGNGDVLLKPEYDEIGQFKNGLALVNKGDKYGYINDRIGFVVPCKYMAVGAYNDNGYVWVNEGGKFKKDARTKVDGGKYGVYNNSGDIIVPVKYKTLGYFLPERYETKTDRLNNMSWAEKHVVTESGEINNFISNVKLDPSRFSMIDNNALGFWVSNSSVFEKNGIFDFNGKELVPIGKYYKVLYPIDGLAALRTKNSFGCSNYFDISSGRLLLPESTYDCGNFRNGFAVVTRPDTPIKKGAKAVNKFTQTLINTEGKTISKEYDKIYDLKDGVHIIAQNGSFGLIHEDGTEIMAATNNILLPPSEGLLICRVNGNDPIGFVDKTGKWIVEPVYKSALSFNHGWAAIKDDNGWGYIDAKGNVVVPLTWNNVSLLSFTNPDVIFVSAAQNNEWQPYDVKKKQVIGDSKYGFIRNFDIDFDGVSIVGTDNSHVGVIDKTGAIIIPMEFNRPSIAMEAYKTYLQRNRKDWTPTDTHRINLRYNTNLNKGRINEKVAENLWDF